MNSMFRWLPIFAAIALSTSAWCQIAMAETGDLSPDFRRYITSRYDPDYPRAARERGLSGSGLALLEINTGTGEVKRVTITKSTGHDILDKSALSAYRRWRFVPHTISQAEVPIIFTALGSVDPSVKTNVGSLAIRSPQPDYPLKAIELDMVGTGAALLEVDQRTGVVTSVRMSPSTGHKLLDDAAMNAFRQWLFKPGTVKQIKIPVHYAKLGGFSY